MKLSQFREYSDDLKRLAEILPMTYRTTADDGGPEMADISWYILGFFHKTVYCYVTNIDEAQNIRRQLLGHWEKKTANNSFLLVRPTEINDREWRIEINIPRDVVCEKVQVGTKTVQKMPENFVIPTIDVEEPVYEWKCPESLFTD